MKRTITAAVAILAVGAGVGWKLASHPQHSAGLRDVKLIEHSEHSQPGPNGALAGIRIRISASDFDDQIRTSAREVPQVARAAE